MNTDIRKYREEIEKTLKELVEEKKVLEEKFSKGEHLSSKEQKRNDELTFQINDLNSKLSLFKKLDMYTEMNESLNQLRSSKLKANDKKEIREKMFSLFKELNKENTKLLAQKLCLDETELDNLEAVKMTIRDEIGDLEAELRVAKRNGSKNKTIEDIKTEIKDQEFYLEEIKEYENNYYNLEEIEADLKLLSNNKTLKAKKDEIVAKYSIIFTKYEKEYEDFIKAIMNEQDVEILDGDNMEQIEATDVEVLDVEDYEVIESKEEKNERLKKVLKTAGKIIGVATLSVAIILVARSCSKNIENDKTNNNSDSKTNIEQTYENTDKQLLDSLTKKGYNELNAVFMIKNFDKETIEALQNSPYNPTVENYANTTKFNLDYINDYENARSVYNITALKAVDYVNRSAKIIETGFYTDVTINEVVEIVMAIDNKELFTSNNANLAQTFNTSFNKIVDNFLFGTVTEEDSKKLDALQYFAADDTDMDKFLTQFATLSKNVLTNPNDVKVQEELFSHLSIFATSLNGFTNEESVLTENTTFNNNAQINDYFDWYIAYNSFVAPLYPIACPVYQAYEAEAQVKYNEISSTITHDTSEEADEILAKARAAYNEYLKTYETDFKKYEDLQYIIITALQGPEFNQLCGESKTLGGEQ